MAEPEPPKRRFYRLHLATLHLLFLLLSAFLYLNMLGRNEFKGEHATVYGWPTDLVARLRNTSEWYFLAGVDEGNRENWQPWQEATGFLGHALGGLAVPLCAILVITCALEVCIYLREGRRRRATVVAEDQAQPVAKKSQRPWFRFHLPTAILLMFVAGGLLWANLTVHYDLCRGSGESGKYGIDRVHAYGWPWDCLQGIEETGSYGNFGYMGRKVAPDEVLPINKPLPPPNAANVDLDWHWPAFLADAFVAFAILAFVTSLIENIAFGGERRHE